MKQEEMAERNRILLLQTGSKLYGTDTAESDDDKVAIFLPDIEYVFGFQKCEMVQTCSKDVDFVQYEFRKFVKLAMECNPNVIELLFCADKNILWKNEFGNDLLDVRHLFPFRDGIVNRFKGYAFSRKHKMTVKKEHYDDLLRWIEKLETYKDNYLFDLKMGDVFKRMIPEKNNFIKAGDIKLQSNWTLKKSYKIIKSRIERVGNRTKSQGVAYDGKFAMHLIRLLHEAFLFLRDGYIEFPFNGDELKTLKEIRNGEWELDGILSLSEKMEKRIDFLIGTTKLPVRQKFDEIQKFTVKMMKKWMKI